MLSPSRLAPPEAPPPTSHVLGMKSSLMTSVSVNNNVTFADDAPTELIFDVLPLEMTRRPQDDPRLLTRGFTYRQRLRQLNIKYRDDHSDSGSDDIISTTEKGYMTRVYTFVKILIPHVILITMLLAYLSIGALVLTKLEKGLETSKSQRKMSKLLQLYGEIANETYRMRTAEGVSLTNWTSSIKQFMYNVADVHDDRFAKELQHYEVDRGSHTSRWTFPTALLYALTVLTTCGYGEVGVFTPSGQLFAVAFALIGIPLMFITAADIGKFLSESLMKMLDSFKTGCAHIKSCFRRCCGHRRRQSIVDIDDEDEPFGVPNEQMNKLWFPIITYVSVISAYCCLGAVMFRNWQGEWKFIHAFHFGFNLIVTVGLGELVVDDPFFLCLIVAFVIIGLSVVTMCVDLASTHLKAYFTQLHYFGRAKKFLDMGDDIRNMMEYLAWMRKKKGGNVTWEDVADLLEQIKRGPYDPSEANRMRWIDETSSQVSTMRQNSCSDGGSKSNVSMGGRKFSNRRTSSRGAELYRDLTNHTPRHVDSPDSEQLLRPTHPPHYHPYNQGQSPHGGRRRQQQQPHYRDQRLPHAETSPRLVT